MDERWGWHIRVIVCHFPNSLKKTKILWQKIKEIYKYLLPRSFATQIFKLKHELATESLIKTRNSSWYNEVFEIQNPAYNFRLEATHFKRENVKATHYGIQSVRYLGQKIWDMVPDNINNCSSLNKFKNSIESWKPNKCPCRLCKKYIARVGFIWFTSTFWNVSEEKLLGDSLKGLRRRSIFLRISSLNN